MGWIYSPMKSLFTLALLGVAVVLHAGPREDLERLKREFPGHVSGQVTKQSDPIIQHCYDKYRSLVMGFTMDSLADDIGEMRNQIYKDTPILENITKEKSRVVTSQMRFAAKQNISWLNLKLIPYLRRLESLQRGR